ncbi:single-stranded DNA-binding protein [Weissella muntiaci]|uniref:Single-stranded DNA-binding protein n=1 Tax=Weissella muntiaci TaxID=2508881 RepID=A0A6C2CAC5_9LACO|nr:single-stranded DNA-binding protein [Weissella muntiaci]TYC50492.1 single-stranded DNA-binding protein [Weissella muntiaci]
MINSTSLTGRLTRDVELKYTQNGAAVASFTLAVERSYTNANGEREADFINGVIWRKPAETFSNFFSKGSLVGIEGRLQTRSYTDQSGQRRYITEVIVENFTPLESKNDNMARKTNREQNNSQANNGQYNAGNNANGNVNGNGQYNARNNVAGNGSDNGFNTGGNSNFGSGFDGNKGNPGGFNGATEVNVSDDDLPF